MNRIIINLIIIAFLFFNCSNDDKNELIDYSSCDGNIVFTSQQEIDDFGKNKCTRIVGSLSIMDDQDGISDITNLDALNSLTIIEGFVYISANPSLVQINGLGNVTTIGGFLTIQTNKIPRNY